MNYTITIHKVVTLTHLFARGIMLVTMSKKRILIIFQESPNLVAAKDELYTVSSMHNAEIVAGGRIGLPDIRKALRFSDKWDIVWFIVDSGWDVVKNAGYMDLEGGATDDDIVSIVRSSGCDLVILNSCNSIAIGTQIAEQTRADVVSTVIDVPDVQAVTFGVSMAKIILDGRSYFDAFRLSRPSGNRTYTYMSSLSSPVLPPKDLIIPSDATIVETLARILDQITSLRSDIYSWRIGVENRLTALESHIFPKGNKLSRRDIYLATIVGVLGLLVTVALVFILRLVPQ